MLISIFDQCIMYLEIVNPLIIATRCASHARLISSICVRMCIAKFYKYENVINNEYILENKYQKYYVVQMCQSFIAYFKIDRNKF